MKFFKVNQFDKKKEEEMVNMANIKLFIHFELENLLSLQ